MKHEQASQALFDLVRGHLEPEESLAIENHVNGCEECRGILATIRTLEKTAREAGVELLEEHPSADDLARFVARDPGMPNAELAQVAAHVRACPACNMEAAITREVLTEKPAWHHRFARWLFPAPEPGLSLRPILAVAAVVVMLAFPAYRGLVVLPRLQDQLDAGSGGGVQLLYLTGATRSPDQPLPAIQLDRGQLNRPLIIDAELVPDPAASADRVLEFSLTPEAAGSPRIWTLRTTVASVWNPDLMVYSLMIPTGDLAAGTYRLQASDPGRDGPLLDVSFRVLPASQE